ncbi:MAG TPA: hypothetical protein PKV13_11705 [Propionicimonas sp.]|nr:hypothetical protein [Propionicimonas sp.]HRA07266.1 hypothetical protein [Propionicimonas sp.]
MTLVFVPVTSSALVAWASGGALAGRHTGYAATPGLTTAFDVSDEEEAEHLALLVASVAGLAATGRRLVAVVEADTAPGSVEGADFGEVVAADLPYSCVQSLFADEADAPGLAEAAGAVWGLELQAAWDHPAVATLLEFADLLWHGAGEWSSLGTG